MPLSLRRRAAASAVALLATLHAGTASAGPDHDDRLAVLNHAIAEHPDDAVLYLRRAMVHSDEQHPEAAMADLNRATELTSPTDTAMVRGILMYRGGKLEAAIAQFDRFLAANPDHENALLYRARVHRDGGEINAAVRDYQRLFALNPQQDPGHYVAAAQLMQRSENFGDSAALALVDERIAAVGAIPQLQNFAIDLERARKNYTGALQRLHSLHPLTRQSAAWHVDIAELLQEAGRPAADIRPHLDAAEAALDGRARTPNRAELTARMNDIRVGLSPQASDH